LWGHPRHHNHPYQLHMTQVKILSLEKRRSN
jgi:hypothetical protein